MFIIVLKCVVVCCNVLNVSLKGVIVCFYICEGWKLYDIVLLKESILKKWVWFNWLVYNLNEVCCGNCEFIIFLFIYGNIRWGYFNEKEVFNLYEFNLELFLFVVELVCYLYDFFNWKESVVVVCMKFFCERLKIVLGLVWFVFLVVILNFSFLLYGKLNVVFICIFSVLYFGNVFCGV